MSSTMIAGFWLGDKVRCHKGVVEKVNQQNPQKDGAVESHASQSARSMGHPREVGIRREPSKNCRGMRAQHLSIIKRCGVQVLFVKSSGGESGGKSSGTAGRV